jgi:chemotaxis protein histidine kinase CheA
MDHNNLDGFFSEEEMDSLKQIAVEELRELCDGLDQAVAALRVNPADADARKQAVHIFHTIGGSAAMAGFTDISAIGISMEGALKKQAAQSSPPDDLLQQIAGAHQKLDSLISEAEKNLL